jgi:hypothetical protein
MEWALELLDMHCQFRQLCCGIHTPRCMRSGKNEHIHLFGTEYSSHRQDSHKRQTDDRIGDYLVNMGVQELGVS